MEFPFRQMPGQKDFAISTCGRPVFRPFQDIQSPWPQTIVCGHTGAAVENGRKTGFGKGGIVEGFWPPPSPGKNSVSGGPLGCAPTEVNICSAAIWVVGQIAVAALYERRERVSMKDRVQRAPL